MEANKEKVCNKCGGDPKPLTDFYKNTTMKDGRLGHCKKCHYLLGVASKIAKGIKVRTMEPAADKLARWLVTQKITPKMLLAEKWKRLAAPLNQYAVSSIGRVLSFWTDPTGEFKVQRILDNFYSFTATLDEKNYKAGLIRNKATVYTHKVQGEAFIPNPKNKKNVSHLDSDTLRNLIPNLRWTTASEAIKLQLINERRDTSLTWKTRKELYGASGMSEKVRKDAAVDLNQVKEIRLLAETKSYTEISKEMDVSYSTVYSIVNRNTWKAVK